MVELGKFAQQMQEHKLQECLLLINILTHEESATWKGLLH